MRAHAGFVAAALLTLCACAPAHAQLFKQFEWPAVNANVIPDVRLRDVVHDAIEEAREAEGRARQASLFAGQASRRDGARSAVGLKTQPVTIAEGTVMTATSYHGRTGPALGVIAYANGATMRGAFGGPDAGTYTAAPESMLASFTGWVFGATTADPNPLEGLFTFRNGDTFTGDANSGLGVYVEAGGGRRFVGKADMRNGAFRPLEGNVVDRQGKLLATVVE